MLDVTFVRKRGQRDHVYVTRDDGSTADWAFPSYGNGLPHDLCHLVVEAELGLTEGFWGLVDQGVDVGLVNNQATLLRSGRPLADEPGVDLSGLMQAEAAVALLGSPARVHVEPVGALVVAHLADPADGTPTDQPTSESIEQLLPIFGTELPGSVTSEAVAAIGRRLGELGPQWSALADGASIRLQFPSTS